MPLYLKKGRKLDALQVMQKASRANPGHYRLQFNAGNLFKKLAEKEAARSAYRRAIKLKPTIADAYMNLALSYRDNGEHDRAIKVYAALLKRKPSYAAAHQQIGFLYYHKMNEKKKGRMHLKRYLELHPGARDADHIKKILGPDN